MNSLVVVKMTRFFKALWNDICILFSSSPNTCCFFNIQKIAVVVMVQPFNGENNQDPLRHHEILCMLSLIGL